MDKSHILFFRDNLEPENVPVVLFKTAVSQDPKLAIKKFIGAGVMSLFIGVFALQAGWVISANAEGAPLTSPATSEETPSPSPSSSGNPITSPENTTKTLKVLNPNGGEVIERGQDLNVAWEAEGTPNYTIYTVNVDYPENPGWVTTIYNPDQKTYGFKVSSLPGNYKIRVVSYFPDSSSISDDSDNYFTVIDTPITAPEESPTPTPTPSASSNPSNNGSSNGGNNGGGNSGGGSVSAPSCNSQAPASAPKIVSAVTTGKNQITLNWTKAGDPVNNYVIAYGLEKGKPLYGANAGNVTTFNVKELSGGFTYFFKVRGGNDCQPGAYSEEIAVKVGGKFINAPAEGFKPGVLGKTVKNSNKPALAKPVVFVNDFKPQAQSNGGLVGKVFNFFSNFFKP
jgi:hypothetical protein